MLRPEICMFSVQVIQIQCQKEHTAFSVQLHQWGTYCDTWTKNIGKWILNFIRKLCDYGPKMYTGTKFFSAGTISNSVCTKFIDSQREICRLFEQFHLGDLFQKYSFRSCKNIGSTIICFHIYINFRTSTHLNIMIERLKIPKWGQCFEQLRLSGNTSFCGNVEQNVYQNEIMYENSTLIIIYEQVEGPLRQGGYFWLHITGSTR